MFLRRPATAADFVQMTANLSAAEPFASADVLYAFQPSADRARFFDQRMRSRLHESLDHLFSQAGPHLTVPRERIDSFLARLKTQPVAPLTFSVYCDLVIAIESDDLQEASEFTEELLSLPAPVAGGPRLFELGDPATDRIAARYCSFVDPGADIAFEVFPPQPDAARACREQIQRAFEIIDAGDAELAAEIRALLREIVLAAGVDPIDDPKALTFDGASAFMLWGAIIINANRRDGEIGMVQMLAHESAHNLLFGMTTDEPLLHNSPDERYASPLRPDPRPLEGIYHATFVSARMYRVMQTLLDRGAVPAALEAKARKDLADNARFFTQGAETIQRHGRLTEIGAAIFQNCCDYMAAVR
jgi:hypothetical protein